MKSSHPLAGKEIDCNGTPPECGHNHHTPYSHAWGLEWRPEDVMYEHLSSDALNEHVRRMLDGQQG